MSARRTIFISGMFDMNNYGDLLFPLVARTRLADAGFDVVAVSPTSGQADFPEALPTIDIGEMLSGSIAPAGILIGGGYMIHANSLAFLDHYGDPSLGNWAGAGLWLGATLAAALRDTVNAEGAAELGLVDVHVAADGDKDVAALKRAGVDRNTVETPRSAAAVNQCAIGRRQYLVEGHHFKYFSTILRSLKGTVLSLKIW